MENNSAESHGTTDEKAENALISPSIEKFPETSRWEMWKKWKTPLSLVSSGGNPLKQWRTRVRERQMGTPRKERGTLR